MMSFASRRGVAAVTKLGSATRFHQVAATTTVATDALAQLQRADAAALAAAARMDAAQWVKAFQNPATSTVSFQAPATVYPDPDFQIAHAPAQSALVRVLPVLITAFFWMSFHDFGCWYADAALPWLATM
jgi:hypothetical protein